MKNLLTILALMMGTTVALNAQAVEICFDSPGQYGPGFENCMQSVVTNVNGDVWSMQMQGFSGNQGLANVTINVATGEFTFDGVSYYPEIHPTYNSDLSFYLYFEDFYLISYDTPTGEGMSLVDLFLAVSCDCPEDLSAQLSACQATNAGLSDAVSAQGQQINELQATIDSLEQANANLQYMYDNAQAATNECEDLLLDLNGIIAAQDDMLADCSDANQTLMDAYADAQQTIMGLDEVNAGLAIDLDECQDYTAWADWFISVLQSDAVTSGEIIDNLTSENEQLAADLYECQSNLDDCSTDLDVVTGQAQNCATLYQEYQLFYVQVTNGLNAEINTLEDSLAVVNGTVDSLETELAVCQSDAEYFELLADDCNTTLTDTLVFYNDVLIGAGTAINELTAEVDLLEGELDLALDLLEECGSDLVECDSVAIAEVEYWMDNYYGAVAEGNALVDSLQTELTAAQECCSSCPAAIEDAVNNAQAQAAEDLLPVLEALADAQECCSSCPAAIETAVDNAIAQCEENNAGELMEVYYNGYNAGLEDCEGEVSGLVDIDGTVINVIGYYNQLGQVIDPRTATGVIIRKHEDGTFSKYFR